MTLFILYYILQFVPCFQHGISKIPQRMKYWTHHQQVQCSPQSKPTQISVRASSVTFSHILCLSTLTGRARTRWQYWTFWTPGRKRRARSQRSCWPRWSPCEYHLVLFAFFVYLFVCSSCLCYRFCLFAIRSSVCSGICSLGDCVLISGLS